MRFGVVIFPGSNCERDCFHVLESVLGQDVSYIWHQQTDLRRFDCVVLPGGFSYGDYLRCGAVARFSPVMEVVRDFAEDGGMVIGICNGFQILLEAGLLPGAIMRNTGLKFICKFVNIRVETTSTPWTNRAYQHQVLSIPIAHNEGNYVVDQMILEEMKRKGQVVFRYCSPGGAVDHDWNPNGSQENIAGICNPEGNVLGMMPHPERASESMLSSTDGLVIWESILCDLERLVEL